MIPCANPLAQYQSHGDGIIEAVKRVLEGGSYVLGPEVARFEEAFAHFCGASHAVGVANGTDALILALKGCGVEPGDEVITVSHTALATVAAVLAAGATPVLVDIEPGYYTMDPASLANAITPRCKAIIPVHLYGQCADMDPILALAREHGLTVIEDCSQAAGASYKGKMAGTIGDVGCFSFYPTKNLGGIGDGGMVVTRDESLAGRVRRLRQYGWDEQRLTESPGVNSRLDELQAAILNVKLPTLDEDNRQRRRIAQYYHEALQELPLALPRKREGAEHVHHLYVVASSDRDVLLTGLLRHGITAGVHYPTPAHRHQGYAQRCILPNAGLPVTEDSAEKVLSLPMYPELSLDDARRVAGAIQSVIEQRI